MDINMTRFMKQHPFEKRIELCRKLVNKYPGRYPVIVSPFRGTYLRISRERFLVPENVTMGHFVTEIRKFLGYPEPTEAILFYAGIKEKRAPNGSELRDSELGTSTLVLVAMTTSIDCL